MSAEERWAQRLEWEQERGELEVKLSEDLMTPQHGMCDVPTCVNKPTKRITVGLVDRKGGHEFEFCAYHGTDEFALDFYQRWRR